MKDSSRPSPTRLRRSARRLRSTHSLRRARRSWRWKTARATGVAATVLLALLVLVTALPALRSGAASWLGALVPTPTATLALGSDHFYFSASVPWSAVSLDGHSITLPRIGRDPPLALSRGVHLLAWRAAPFLPQHCLLAVPYSVSNTCARASYYGNQSSQPAVNLVLLDESLATLSPAQQQGLVSGLSAALAGFSDIVRPGEIYAAGDGAPFYTSVATAPVRATLRLTLDVAVAQPSGASGGTSCQLSDICPFTPQNCSQLCTIGDLVLRPLQAEGVAVDQRAWYVIAFARLGWDFATLSGHSLGNAPISPGGLSVADFPLLFALTWDGSASTWHAQPLIGLGAGALIRPFNEAIGTIAASGSSSLVEPGCAALPDFIGPSATIARSTAIRAISAPNPAQGCLAVVVPPGAGADATLNVSAAWYLYRFGVLLAANALAHQEAPKLPQADAYERALATQLAASGA